MISRDLRKNQIVKYYNCDKQGVDRAFLETMIFLRIIYSEDPSLLVYVEGVANAAVGLMNVGQRGIFRVTLCHWKTP